MSEETTNKGWKQITGVWRSTKGQGYRFSLKASLEPGNYYLFPVLPNKKDGTPKTNPPALNMVARK